MHISLTNELEDYVKAKVATGMYSSASEVMREALRLMEERETLDSTRQSALKAAIDQGLSSLEQEGPRPLDIERVKTKGRSILCGNTEKSKADPGSAH